MISRVKDILKKWKHIFLWRKKNMHNSTYPKNIFNIDNVIVGMGTYGEINLGNDTQQMLYIGNYVSIGGNVTFLLGLDHITNTISTFPFRKMLLNAQVNEAISKGDIIIDDDVWLGTNSTIMSGVHIGQGAVVAAGAVVTKDVPPYAIVGGVPAKIIKFRFEPELIKELVKIDYSKLSKGEIEKHIDELYVELINTTQLEWMPKK